MELAPTLEETAERSPLAGARLQRQLTVEEAASRARLTPSEVTWLEEGRLYRFGSSQGALLALLLYSTALGIDRREARELAGLPIAPRPFDANPRGRLTVAAAVVALLCALAAAIVGPGMVHASESKKKPTGPTLPSPWRISVDVFNGSGDINYTRRVADRIGALAYRVTRVARARRFDYPETAVYFPPGGEAIGARLAAQLGVESRPLPGGRNPRRLVVIVGPARAVD